MARHIESSNAMILQLMEIAKDKNFSRQQVADEIGISPSYLGQMISGKEPVGRVHARAAEAVVRRFKAVDTKVKMIVAHVVASHWTTVALVIKNLRGEVIDEFEALLTTEQVANPERFVVAIYSIDNQHEPAIRSMITSTGGQVRKTI